MLFNRIRTELKLMLDSTTKSNWENAYLAAREKLEDHPEKIEILDKIYNDPTYYSGYHLRSIRRNLWLRGNVPAEQNHSSLHAFLGQSMCTSLAIEVQKLLQRHQQKYKEDRQHDVSVHISEYNYESEHSGSIGFQDVLAKRPYLRMHILHYEKGHSSSLSNFVLNWTMLPIFILSGQKMKKNHPLL